MIFHKPGVRIPPSSCHFHCHSQPRISSPFSVFTLMCDSFLRRSRLVSLCLHTWGHGLVSGLFSFIQPSGRRHQRGDTGSSFPIPELTKQALLSLCLACLSVGSPTLVWAILSYVTWVWKWCKRGQRLGFGFSNNRESENSLHLLQLETLGNCIVIDASFSQSQHQEWSNPITEYSISLKNVKYNFIPSNRNTYNCMIHTFLS